MKRGCYLDPSKIEPQILGIILPASSNSDLAIERLWHQWRSCASYFVFIIFSPVAPLGTYFILSLPVGLIITNFRFQNFAIWAGICRFQRVGKYEIARKVF